MRKVYNMLGKLIIIAVVIAVAAYVAWDNSRVVVTTLSIPCAGLPDAFAGFRIALVSDLHNDEFGEGNERLIELIKKQNPDMIAITGDLLDSRRTDVKKALHFATEAVALAPTYYVTGNHESRKKEYLTLEQQMQEAGVCVLRDQGIWLEKEGDKIAILGVDDPRFKLSTDKLQEMEETIGTALAELQKEFSPLEFTILLSHRPELFELYVKKQLGLVLTGHAHGGQFRLPFVGGLIGPAQGLFPEYDAGLYTKEGTHMVVSRGLGQSIVPFRLNNPPELVLIELKEK